MCHLEWKSVWPKLNTSIGRIANRSIQKSKLHLYNFLMSSSSAKKKKKRSTTILRALFSAPLFVCMFFFSTLTCSEYSEKGMQLKVHWYSISYLEMKTIQMAKVSQILFDISQDEHGLNFSRNHKVGKNTRHKYHDTLKSHFPILAYFSFIHNQHHSRRAPPSNCVDWVVTLDEMICRLRM